MAKTPGRILYTSNHGSGTLTRSSVLYSGRGSSLHHSGFSAIARPATASKVIRWIVVFIAIRRIAQSYYAMPPDTFRASNPARFSRVARLELPVLWLERIAASSSRYSCIVIFHRCYICLYGLGGGVYPGVRGVVERPDCRGTG